MMRIITGKAKGKKLFTLDGDATRPTSERIKGAIFSAIQFDIEGRRVLDLFAGSGQMGLEALSRGATGATFIDSSREAMEIVKKNAKVTGFFDNGKYIVSDGANYLRKSAGREKYDLVFIDPPYAMNLCKKTVEALLRYDVLCDGAIVVLESGEEEISLEAEPYSAFEVIKSTSYGKKTAVNILLYRKSKEAEAEG
ncbi:MAG: 16S rRNA (guanine(966)-N(2))-methyltransferase RsmD [Clostridia bacterium]|nr:16S rRNA (guanine(966)-N(2))-methyltransferase RsmD [Clostridia bacterium]